LPRAGFHGVRLAFEVRRRRSNGQDLHLDPGAVHQLESLAKLVVHRPGLQPPVDRGAGIPKPGKKVEVSFAPEMSMHIYPHGRLSLLIFA
jgi:hypothetical protein